MSALVLILCGAPAIDVGCRFDVAICELHKLMNVATRKNMILCVVTG